MKHLTTLLLVVVATAACSKAGSPADRQDVSARMATVVDPIDACYAAALKRDRKLAGVMTLSFVAEAKTGKFINVVVNRDELNDMELQQCVVAEVGKLKLEKPAKTNLAIDYPLEFAPTN
ncbi:MAG: AgmX/PglI C-terminal domain-containing protein [Nannocystis sp.]|nr:AgmX/PglI C-terminal domain-containing protein [Nannocystis sp.]MBA3549128.1 AgmX/PglI C-terminal domain-containing protein [Nannocystis sp.]